MDFKQYNIVIVNLDPTVGSEIKKTRPCVIISPNEMNLNLGTLLIAPITSTSKEYPTRLHINQSQTTGWVMLDQLRTIDKQRVIKIIDSLSSSEIKKMKAIIKETYVD